MMEKETKSAELVAPNISLGDLPLGDLPPDFPNRVESIIRKISISFNLEAEANAKKSKSNPIPEVVVSPRDSQGFHEESKILSTEDDNQIFGLSPGGIPKSFEGSKHLLHYEWTGTKGREAESRLPPSKLRADRHIAQHLDNLPDHTADEAWEVLESIPFATGRDRALSNASGLEGLILDKSEEEVLALPVIPIPVVPLVDPAKEQRVETLVANLMDFILSEETTTTSRTTDHKPKKIKPTGTKSTKKTKKSKSTSEYYTTTEDEDTISSIFTNNSQIEYNPFGGNVGILPPRAAAFPAPILTLPRPTYPNSCHIPPNAQNPEDEEGLIFSFTPRPDFITVVTFTVEPKKRPIWETMMKCGFTPAIYCSVPPTCLPANCSPNLGLSSFPQLLKIKGSTRKSSSSSSSGNSNSNSEEGTTETESGSSSSN